MKIERIADNAINIYISNKELTSRNIEAATLKEGTLAYNNLVWDAIDFANIEYGHEFEARQLNIIKNTDGNGGIILTVAHDIDEDYGDNMFCNDGENIPNSFDNSDDNDEYDEDDEDYDDEYDEDYDDYEDETEDSDEYQDNFSYEDGLFDSLKMHSVNNEAFQNIYEKLRMKREQQMAAQTYPNGKAPAPQGTQPPSGSHNTNQNTAQHILAAEQPAVAPPKYKTPLADWDVLIFPDLNDMLVFFSRNKSFKAIASSLYFYRGAYYLVLKPNSRNIRTLNRLEALAIDYNSTYLPAESFLPLLEERGIVVMENGAIAKLIKHFEL